MVRQALAAHGVRDDLLATLPGSTGLYTISTDIAGERSFHYWRDQAPARQMLDHLTAAGALAAGPVRAVLLSGITLWVLRERTEALIDLLSALRAPKRRHRV